jgi:hypothetical protein
MALPARLDEARLACAGFWYGRVVDAVTAQVDEGIA